MAEQITLTDSMAQELIDTYGSPLYVYDEAILRRRCRELKSLLPLPNYRPLYSVKANSNPVLLRIIREEGFFVDAMSPGEIFLEEQAGFTPSEIFMVTNNISDEEIRFAADRGILMSADSLSQLARFGMLYPGGEVAVRLNPGIGAGHSQKVVTGGSCKFGIEFEKIPELLRIAENYRLRIVGINQHVGSLFLESESFLTACRLLLSVAGGFPDLRIIDFGGGYGVPYQGEPRLDLAELSRKLTALVTDYLKTCPNPDMMFYTESGRYISAECCELLGTVQSKKEVAGVTYVGTDLGFNVLIRPVLYDSWHEVEVFRRKTAGQSSGAPEAAADVGKASLAAAGTEEAPGSGCSPEYETVQIAGNICESGDILAKDRRLPVTRHGDIIGVKNAGAYGYSMASNYNSRLRPAEVLLLENGEQKLIRRRDSLEDLMRGVLL